MDARALRHVFGFERRSGNVTTASKFHFDDAFKPFPTPTLLIVHTRQLERALAVFVDHYNGHRPRRSLGLAPPNGRPWTEKTDRSRLAVKRRDRLIGLLHEYQRAA